MNGEYTFKDIKANAGYYDRIGEYHGKPARFTLYKCSLKNGGYQWFISTTPDGHEPGTSHDTDFYYCHAKLQDKIPPTNWHRTQGTHTRDPPPQVRFVRIRQADEVNDDTTKDMDGSLLNSGGSLHGVGDGTDYDSTSGSDDDNQNQSDIAGIDDAEMSGVDLNMAELDESFNSANFNDDNLYE